MKRVWDITLQVVTEEPQETEEEEMEKIQDYLEDCCSQGTMTTNFIVATLNGTIENET